MEEYPMTKAKAYKLDAYNQVFSGAFLVELILKLIGLQPKNYLKDPFNRFDAFVVLCSIIEIVISNSFPNGSTEILVAFKALRLLRIVKLARSWDTLQKTLMQVYQCFVDIGYFSILVFLFMWIAALLGMELFAFSCFFDYYGNRITDI
jgi:hypothetical protein